jgi:acyl-CoA synthetase (AMP-forming)/AMP-acid ligase II
MPRFEQTIALQLIEQERVEESFMVPTMLRLLLENAHDYDLSSLRTLLYGAAPINSSLLQLAMSTLPHVDFVQAYGQTEAASVITVLSAPYHTLSGPHAGKLDTAGRPINVAEVRIVDAKGFELCNGEIGEICARGPTLMLGYWNKPEQTAIALRDGWLHTGDSGYLDSDGFLHVVDRLNDMIITGGENVYSTEVEDILSRHPDVAMCAVVGIPDERWGEKVHGVVILRVGAHVDEADLIAHCRALIAAYKCPRSIEFRSELPISAAGKLLKYVLRDAYWKNQPRRIG